MSESTPSDRARRSDRRRDERRHRRGGRRGRRFVPDTSVPSPCIKVCQVDDETGCCIGCLRSIDEIRDWPILTAEEKKEVLARVARRRTAATRPGEA